MWTCGVDDVPPSIAARFAAGSTFAEVLARKKEHSGLWDSIYHKATLIEEARDTAASIAHRRNLLVLNEDWCGDSVNILPYVARVAEASDKIELRIIGRDANRDIMDAHLTGKSRSIPIVIVYDEEFTEKGWWGPRPGPLQRWVLTEGLALPRPDRYPLIRAWYARDKGRTIASEILAIIEKGDH
jgi:hypothetical protein